MAEVLSGCAARAAIQQERIDGAATPHGARDIARCIETIEKSYAFASGTIPLERCGEWKYLKELISATPQPAPHLSWPQDAPPLLHTELLGPDGMRTPSEAEMRQAFFGDEQPAPDAMRPDAMEILRKIEFGCPQGRCPYCLGWDEKADAGRPNVHTADCKLAAALSAPVPTGESVTTPQQVAAVFRCADLTYEERLLLKLIAVGPREDRDGIPERVLVNRGYAERFDPGMLRITDKGRERDHFEH